MYSIVLMGPGQARLEENDNMDISLGGFRAGASVSLEDTAWLLVTLPGEAEGSRVAPKPWPAVATRGWETIPLWAEWSPESSSVTISPHFYSQKL